MALVGIVAVDRNLAIGRGGELPWHYRADLQFFRARTTGHACVMGRNTWRSLKKPLPNRLNLVLSRTGGDEVSEGSVIFLPRREAVVDLAEYLRGDIFIIGGAAIFDLFANDITRWIVTHIPLEVADADVHLPSNFLAGFTEWEATDLGEGLVAKVYDRNAS